MFTDEDFRRSSSGSAASAEPEQTLAQELGIIAGLIMYAILFTLFLGSGIVDIVSHCSRRRRSAAGYEQVRDASDHEDPENHRRSRISLWYHLAAYIFCALRIFQTYTNNKRALYDQIYAVLLRRLGSCVYFSMMSFTVYWWAVSYGRMFLSEDKKNHLPKVKGVLICLNGLAYMLVAVFVGWLAVDRHQGNNQTYGNWKYEATVYTIIGMQVLISLLVVVFVLIFWRKQKKEVWFLRAEKHNLKTVFIFSCVFLICAMVSFTMLMWRPITGRDNFPEPLYSFLCYYATEFIVCILQLVVIRTHAQSSGSDGEIIKNLFFQTKNGNYDAYDPTNYQSLNADKPPTADGYFMAGSRCLSVPPLAAVGPMYHSLPQSSNSNRFSYYGSFSSSSADPMSAPDKVII